LNLALVITIELKTIAAGITITITTIIVIVITTDLPFVVDGRATTDASDCCSVVTTGFRLQSDFCTVHTLVPCFSLELTDWVVIVFVIVSGSPFIVATAFVAAVEQPCWVVVAVVDSFTVIRTANCCYIVVESLHLQATVVIVTITSLPTAASITS